MHITIFELMDYTRRGQVHLAHPVAHHVLASEDSLSEHAGTEAGGHPEEHCGVVVVRGGLDDSAGKGGGVGRLEDTRSDEDSIATELQGWSSVTA